MINTTVQDKVRPLKNKAESECREHLISQGWNVTKRGWPDFFCWKDTGEIMAVEVKRDDIKGLKKSQQLVMSALNSYGLKTIKMQPKDIRICSKCKSEPVYLPDIPTMDWCEPCIWEFVKENPQDIV